MNNGRTQHRPTAQVAASPPAYELEAWRDLADALPGDSLRFDPNAALSVEQAIRFGQTIQHLRNDYFEAPTWGLSGMCRGEILVLGARISTSGAVRSLSDGPRAEVRAAQGAPGQPKIAEERRSIALPAVCVDAPRRHRAQQAEQQLRLEPHWEDHGFVFTGHAGRRMSTASMPSSGDSSRLPVFRRFGSTISDIPLRC